MPASRLSHSIVWRRTLAGIDHVRLSVARYPAGFLPGKETRHLCEGAGRRLSPVASAWLEEAVPVSLYDSTYDLAILSPCWILKLRRVTHSALTLIQGRTTERGLLCTLRCQATFRLSACSTAGGHFRGVPRGERECARRPKLRVPRPGVQLAGRCAHRRGWPSSSGSIMRGTGTQWRMLPLSEGPWPWGTGA